MAQSHEYERIILGVDPGTNVMGYGIVGIHGKTASLIALGVIRLSKISSHYERLSHIYRRISGIVDSYRPDELAIEAPFFGKNVQSMLKLGRAQGVAIAAAMGQKGTMSALRRTAAGLYTGADAHTLEEILAAKEQGNAALEALMLPVESVFTPLPLLMVEPWVEQHLYNGCPTSRYPAADGRYRVRNAAGQLLGLANITGGVLRVEKLFVERN